MSAIFPDARLAVLARVSGLTPAEVHHRLFESGFDLACDRGDYSLEQQCMEIRSRLERTSSPLQLAGFWAQAFSPNSDILDIVSHVRSRVENGTPHEQRAARSNDDHRILP